MNYRPLALAAALVLAFHSCIAGCTQQNSPVAPAPAAVKDTSMPNSQASGATDRKLSKSGYDLTQLSKSKVAELAGKLDAEAYRVTQKSGTEPPGCGTLLDNKRKGTYTCIVCGLPLFSSEHKFNSGTGWPSFYSPVDEDHIAYIRDVSGGMERVEINCKRCSAHLGHVFDDGPQPTGNRYCLNSAALIFHDLGTLPKDGFTENPTGLAAGEAAITAAGGIDSKNMETAYFAGGCFWGVEHWFDECPGVIQADSGYMGGNWIDPTYEAVCSGETNHAETVRVVFDPAKVSYKTLLEGFFMMHDPTQLNRQGPDHGTQYRSAIFCTSDEQLQAAQDAVKALGTNGPYKGQTVVTQVLKGGVFYPAETYHQDYLVKNPSRTCHVVNPWPTVLGTAGKSGAAH